MIESDISDIKSINKRLQDTEYELKRRNEYELQSLNTKRQI